MAALLVTRGKEVITDAIAAFALFVGWGTGAGTTAIGDTTLFSEAPEARGICSGFNITTTTANDTVRLIGTITALAPRAITNAGIFDAAVAGGLFVKADFAAIPLAVGESIQFLWDVVIS